ncbi:MAG: amino acid ABC transporter permease [Chloroflexi bacterium]|nr:amino acid ABC transporter permease [Chloroflexota bacterium]
MTIDSRASGSEKPKVALLNDPKFRAIIFQSLLVLFIAWLAWGMISNAAHNLQKAGIASGFGFLDKAAGFGINFSPFIEYQETSTYMVTYWVGLQNTLILAVIGVIVATFLGFVIGVARLSTNWVVAKIAYVYVEILRNIPLLLQIFIWYKGVLATLPNKRNSLDWGVFGQLNAAGLFAPKPVTEESFSLVVWALVAALVLIFIIARWAKKRQTVTGQRFPVFWTAVALIILLPLIVYLLSGQPLTFEQPVNGKFGPKGGMQIIPEFIALILALSTYTAAFIAEIVRAGILAVNKGQSEASYALGLTRGQTLRLNVIPQAMRVIIPPLTSQYLNLTKNSSLAVAIAYPDLTAVFAGTALNQTGQAVEILIMTMLTYLVISLITSMFMNWYNAKMSLVER